MKKSALRWVPAIAVPAVVIAGAVAIPSMANADVNLPSKSAKEIVTLAQKSVGTSFSGTVSETANLGLPDIPSSALGSGASSSDISAALSQLTGTHKAKVYVSGTSASRIQTLDDLAERDVTRSGNDVWAYDSQKNTVAHVTLPDKGSFPSPSTSTMPTPSDVAQQVLDQVGKYTTITTSNNAMVAGQKAYAITLTPKDSTTLVGSITLSVDSQTGVPLKAVVTAKGQKDPAYSTSFSSIDYSKPAASTFAFTPPKGAKVTNLTVPTRGAHGAPAHAMKPGALRQGDMPGKGAARKFAPTVIGTGWSTILGVTLPTATGSTSTGQSKLLDQVLTPVIGGKILQTSLVSVFIANDGKVYVGAVSASDLEAAVAAQK